MFIVIEYSLTVLRVVWSYFAFVSKFSRHVWALTGEHALVDDTVSADEDGVTLHDAAVPRNLHNVSRYQQVRRDILVLYKKTKITIL